MFSLVLAAFLTATAQPPKSKCAANTCVPTGKRICTLAVQITTSKNSGAGTDNAVYFDIGPLSWRLNNPGRNDFEAGHTDEFDISPPCDLTVTTDDILWLRLHKKGLGGFTGTSDGFTGAWHPEKLVLIVNGAAWITANINEPLNSRCWFWSQAVVMQPRESYANAASFVKALRLQPQAELGAFSKFIGFATTNLFKKRGISGWRECPDSIECQSGKRVKRCAKIPANVCASGRVRAVAKSTDGFATIDLEVSEIGFCDEGRSCDEVAIKNLDPVNKRYLRIEYRHKGRRVPRLNEEVRMCGSLHWDTDKEGWWEIHPR
ncbi:MAG TPA: PLAT/LH2 domain-containing protein [Pyrinomonadaceae bacterium]